MRYCFALGSFNSGILENIVMYILYLQIFVRNYSVVIVNYWIHVVIIWILSFALFFCFCMFVWLEFFVQLENFFTYMYMETSPLSVKGCKFWPMFGTHGHWAVKVFWPVTPVLLWHGSSVYAGHLRGPVTLAPIAERLAVELSLPVLSRLRFEHPTFRLRCERSNPLRHRRGLILSSFLINEKCPSF